MSEPDQSKDRSAGQAAQPASAPAAKRNWFARHWIVSLLALLVGSCAFFTRDRTVSWEEEVPLNTGETIWVKRYATYKFDVTQDNPFVPRFFPDRSLEVLSFEWQSRKYSYTGGAALMLIAISPQSMQPVLIAMRSTSGTTKDLCQVAPFYDQLILNQDKWQWEPSPQVERWAMNLPRNLMAHRDEHGEMQKRYTAEDRRLLDANMMRAAPSTALVNEFFQPEICLRRTK